MFFKGTTENKAPFQKLVGTRRRSRGHHGVELRRKARGECLRAAWRDGEAPGRRRGARDPSPIPPNPDSACTRSRPMFDSRLTGPSSHPSLAGARRELRHRPQLLHVSHAAPHVPGHRPVQGRRRARRPARAPRHPRAAGQAAGAGHAGRAVPSRGVAHGHPGRLRANHLPAPRAQQEPAADEVHAHRRHGGAGRGRHGRRRRDIRRRRRQTRHRPDVIVADGRRRRRRVRLHAQRVDRRRGRGGARGSAPARRGSRRRRAKERRANAERKRRRRLLVADRRLHPRGRHSFARSRVQVERPEGGRHTRVHVV